MKSSAWLHGQRTIDMRSRISRPLPLSFTFEVKTSQVHDSVDSGNDELRTDDPYPSDE